MADPSLYMLQAQALSDTLKTDRRWLHAHAEVGLDLPKTTAYVRQQLQHMGYEAISCGQSGIVALAGGKKPGKVFLIRGDMDALPIQEESGVTYACNAGSMHACGHDLHTAMLLGAARILKLHEDEIEGTVKFMFQPAEEILEGAKDMIDHGVLENPKVDAAMMIHVNVASESNVGTLISSAPGISAASADFFTIYVKGFGCHGANPHLGVDPITVSAHILLSLQQIHARELPLSDRAILTIGSIAGGTAGNIIPSMVTMQGSIRAFDESTREFMKKRLVEIAECTATVFGAAADVSFERGTPTVVNDRELSDSIPRYLCELVGNEKVFCYSEGKAPLNPGSEDFGYVSHLVPSLSVNLAAGQKGRGYDYPLHHASTIFDESALPIGAATYAYAAVRWLEDHK